MGRLYGTLINIQDNYIIHRHTTNKLDVCVKRGQVTHMYATIHMSMGHYEMSGTCTLYMYIHKNFLSSTNSREKQSTCKYSTFVNLHPCKRSVFPLGMAWELCREKNNDKHHRWLFVVVLSKAIMKVQMTIASNNGEQIPNLVGALCWCLLRHTIVYLNVEQVKQLTERICFGGRMVYICKLNCHIW